MAIYEASKDSSTFFVEGVQDVGNMAGFFIIKGEFKNMIRFRKRNSSLCLEEIGEIGVSETDSGIFEAIMSLPAKYKLVMDLHYIEGYTASEISAITGVNADAVRKRMQNGRKLLKKTLEEAEL